MRTSLTRVVASVAIAATAVLAGAGAASASTTTTGKTPTQLAVSVAKGSITVGHSDTVGGYLHAGKTPVAGRIVILDKWSSTAKKWYSVEEKFTGKSGKVAFGVDPKSTAWYVLVYKGGPIYKPTHSAEVRIVVKPFVKTPTTLKAWAKTYSIKAGSTDVFYGFLSITKGDAALRYQWVWLDTVGKGGKVHHVRAFKTGKDGHVSFTVKPAATTTYELQFLGTKVLAKTVSNAVTITVAS
jgi:hypothetical protein